MKTLTAGWYVVTADTRNPNADRRSKRFSAVPVWKAGTRVQVGPLFRHGQPATTGPLTEGRITGPDRDVILFCQDSSELGLERQGNELTDNLAPEPERLGQVLKDSFLPDAGYVLAALLEKGTVTMEQVKAALAEMEAMSDDTLDAIGRRHAV